MKNHPYRQLWNVFFLMNVLLVLILVGFPAAVFCAELPDDELLSGASQRIEKHRMADAVISVVDALGNPVTGARISVEQTRHAFLFGCNIFQWGRLPNETMETAYRQHYAELLNYATLPFYWNSYEPRRGEPMHERTEKIARWCQEHGILTKGHPLAWNMGDPRWLPDDLDEIHHLQMARIDDCVSRFVGLIDRWDVVNEVTHYDRPEFVNNRSPKISAMWKRTGQIEFTRECFLHARKAGPKATLLINDYRTDPAFERVIEQLVDDANNRLYDVIGIQSHMHGGPWPSEKIWEVCERFARFGVPLHFTETTILSGRRGGERPRPWNSTPEGEVFQAREAVRFYTMLFSHPAVEAITWWDFSDYHAWQEAPAGFLRKDMTPKPMYDELKKLIKGTWWTKVTLTTGVDGKGNLRGFLGEYKITVSIDGKQDVTKEFTLAKGQPNQWMIKME
ncbi:MAG: endo-1,4-beta-xylanase [Pirellulales bacterium]|nr:endo-1,4-beta-xylanase [Pirellulales bacterium]